MTSTSKNTQHPIVNQKKPYLLPRTNWKSWSLLGVVALNVTHAIFHYVGSTQCTRNIYPVGPCDEFVVDTMYHLLHVLASIYSIQRRQGSTHMKFLCILPMAISLFHISQMVFTDLMMDIEGFHDNDGFRKHTPQHFMFCHGFSGSLGIWWLIDSLELSFALGVSLSAPAMVLVHYGYGMPGTVTLVFVDALFYVFLSGERETVSQSAKYWSNRLSVTWKFTKQL